MDTHDNHQPDYGTGQKSLGIYVFGVFACAALTLISFWAVMSSHFSKAQIFVIIFSSACIQFLVQVICFLRLNMKTEQGQMNVLSFIFSGVILISIILGSLWIMASLNYNMMG